MKEIALFKGGSMVDPVAWVFKLPADMRIKPSDRYLAQILAKYCAVDGRTYLSQPDLARKTRLAKDTIRVSINRLAAAGVLTIEHNAHQARNGKLINVYRLALSDRHLVIKPICKKEPKMREPMPDRHVASLQERFALRQLIEPNIEILAGAPGDQVLCRYVNGYSDQRAAEDVNQARGTSDLSDSHAGYVRRKMAGRLDRSGGPTLAQLASDVVDLKSRRIFLSNLVAETAMKTHRLHQAIEIISLWAAEGDSHRCHELAEALEKILQPPDNADGA